MGFGDDLLITAHASQIKKQFPDRQIVIGSVAKKNASHSIIYENNPNISNCNNLDYSKPIHIIDYHPGNRPYIDYKNSTNKKYVWNKEFKAVPGELYFTRKEEEDADKIIKKAIDFWNTKNKHKFKSIIFYEPSSTKIDNKQFGIKQINKAWSDENWLKLAKKLQNEYLLIQSIHSKSKKINGIYSPDYLDFRSACALMSKCDLYVGLEGGFVQVAGALNKKAVVYYGGWIDPKIIGYKFHENLYYENTQSPCGEYVDICNHCEEARRHITVEFFLKKIQLTTNQY